MRNIFLLLLVAVFMPRNTFAYDFEVDGIYYEAVSLTDFTCKVVSGDVKYSGEIVIPETVNYGSRTLAVVEIGDYAFYDCEDLEGIVIPNSVIKIASDAFGQCHNLTHLSIGNAVTEIGDNAFNSCGSLKSVVIPNSVTKIGTYAFHGCTNLTEVTIGNSVKEIMGKAFSECKELISVTIPNSVVTIGDGAFSGCNELKSAIIGDGVTEIGSFLFENCSKLTDATIGKSVTNINQYVFRGCSSLKSIVIPNSAKKIDYNAFENCSSLTSVTIGSAVKEILYNAFDGCGSITTIYSLNTTPPSAQANSFVNNAYMLANVYVPKESIETYKTTDIWNNFWNILEYTGDEPKAEAEKCATPSIQYSNGKLTFSCATKDAVCQTSITDTDVKMHTGNEIQLGVTYNISVYATKAGYAQSDVATATLCWIDAEPKTDGIGNGVAEVKALPVLIQSANGQISISGLDDGTLVCVYGANGVLTGSAVSNGGQVCVGTNMAAGSIAIVKIGERSVKALVK